VSEGLKPPGWGGSIDADAGRVVGWVGRIAVLSISTVRSGSTGERNGSRSWPVCRALA